MQVSRAVVQAFPIRVESAVSPDFIRVADVPVRLGSFDRPGRPTSNKWPGAGDDQKPKRSTSRNRVLLLGRLQELALYRAEVLRDRGFEVRTSTDYDEALRLIRSNDYDAIVLSYTLSSATVQELAEEARQHCPECPLVVIANTRTPDRRIVPDDIAIADEGPAALVAALHRVLRLQ